jgi:hypothetical protein
VSGEPAPLFYLQERSSICLSIHVVVLRTSAIIKKLLFLPAVFIYNDQLEKNIA